MKSDFYKNLRIKNANLYKFYLSDIPGISMQINKSNIFRIYAIMYCPNLANI